MKPAALLLQGDARHLPLRDKSVQCVVSSPPYWGLRDYGLPPLVWDEPKGGCEHEWGAEVIRDNHAGHHLNAGLRERDPGGRGGTQSQQQQPETIQQGAFCRHSGCWRGSLGLEPTPDLFVKHLVECMREVRRVLRDDGTCWLNLGDSYSGSWGNYAPGGIKGVQRPQTEAGRRMERPAYADTTFLPPNARVPGLKSKDLIGIPWRAAFALQADGWWLRSDIIWCLSGGTRLYAKTQKGEMPTTLKDLVRLRPETVQLWNGQKWTRVLGWSESARAATLEIELRSGERIGCTPHHKWPTQRGRIRSDGLVVGDVIQTCRLPEPEADTPSNLPDETVGWFVGTYLADGSRSTDTIQIASNVNELDRYKRLRDLAEDFHGTCVHHHTSERGVTINLNGPVLNAILDTYLSGRMAKHKHLHPRCWRRSNGFLGALLRGYLEGDGHYDEGNKRWRLGFTKNDALATDLRTLCARVGASLRLRRCVHQMRGRKFPGWRGEIHVGDRPPHFNQRPDGEIVAIRRSRARRFYHVGMADELHLFALASGVLTSNSKPNPMPESVTDRPTRSHEYLFLLSKRATYYYDAEAIKEEASSWPGKMPDGWDTSLGAHGTIHRAGREKGREQDPVGDPRYTGFNARYEPTPRRNRRTVWEIATAPFPDAHFATFPPALVTPCILAGTSERGACPACGAPWERILETKYERLTGSSGMVRDARDTRAHSIAWSQGVRAARHDTTLGWRPTCACGNKAGGRWPEPPVPCLVLDPFAGAGTVPLVAQALGRVGVGVELKREYLDMARKRTAQRALL